HCLHPVETFTLDYEEQLYHYTLYYYDQADLLTKIIPPAGVHLLSDPAVKQAALFRNTGTGDPVQPQHSMATTNKYNSLNTIIANSSPDGGSTLYCYDELGRLIYKQDANQSANPAVRRASFTSYDNIGRVIQTGEIPVKYFQLPSHLTYLEFTDQLQASDKYKTDVVTTFYDRPATPINGGFDFNLSTLHQRNLRNRVSANIYHRSFMDNTPYTHAFFYNYDIDGNIDTLVQDNRFLENYAVRLNLCSGLGFHRFKTMAYNYDLISKKVNSNWYQPNQIDQLLHLYEYDADNRLVKVRTTTRPWEHPSDIDIDAAYQFYLHGPIARLELGQEKIQGLDYTYTLQGWMKGVNSSLPGAGADPGKDDGTAFLKDAFAYGLNYYPKDYTPIGTSSPMPETENTALGQGFSKPVFNGNIRNMLTMLDAFSNDKVQATAYNYDVLGRMMSMQAYQPKNSQLAVWQDGNFTEAYHTQYGYDPNGNILTLSRKDGAGTIMDNLSYTYKPNTNQVSMILDAAGNPTGKDILNNNQYAYDAGGRLIKRSEGPSPSNNFDISWSGFDRLRNIKKNENNIEFVYNAAINRALTFDEASRNATYYVRDLVGNALAIYSLTPTDVLLDEQLLYGQERIGTLNAHTKLTAAETTDKLTFFRGSKEYELTNHLGNVLATVSDRRIPSGTGWTSDNLTAQDYYPFGTIMSKRSLNKPGTYRYGFNGKEMDTLIDDRNINLDFGARAYLSGTGQWLTMDPLADKYPGLSPYHFAFDNPVKFIDPDGRKVYASKNANNTYTVTGGTLDDDRGIYVKDKKGREKQIGESLTANSFFSDEGKVVVGAIIDPSTKEGTQFLLDVVNDKKTGLVEYALNARNGYKYDYKSRNTPAVLSGKGRDVYHYRAEALFTKNGVKVFATARDIGNIGAG
ncbi:MAG TPA: RHS repeat-associated core domain-containing protein, partial [Puia sp.]